MIAHIDRSIPLTRRPSNSDLYYDPTFTPSPQKSLKIPIPRLCHAPPLPNSKSRRFSHGEVEGKPLRSCLLYRQQSTDTAPGDAVEQIRPRPNKLSRALSVDRASARSDPMSVLPVCRTTQTESGPPPSPLPPSALQSGRPPLSILTGTSSGSRTDSSPTIKSRPGMFGNFKRPSFLKRRTNSTDDKNAFGSNGASLKRWTSDSSSSALSPGAASPASTPKMGDFDGPPSAGRGYFSEQGRGANVPPCIMEDQALEVEDESADDHGRHDMLKSPVGLDEGEDKYTLLRPCCPQCSRATDKGLEADWVPPVSKRAQKKLDVEHMVRQIEDKKQSVDEADEAVDEKASSFVVDEVELLRRRRTSGGSGSHDDASQELKPASQTCLLGTRPGSASPRNGPVWLCSGKGRSSSSGSVSRQSPVATPGRATPDSRSPDYFALASQDAATARAAQDDLDAKIATALAAEAFMARGSSREQETSACGTTGSETTGNGARSGEWFRRMAEGGGVVSV